MRETERVAINNSMTTQTFVAILVEGKVRVIKTLACCQVECKLSGCSFPDCGELDDKEYATLEEAAKDYAGVRLIADKLTNDTYNY